MTNLFIEGFHLKSKTGIQIDMPINAKVSVITGDSATGKTKMINDIAGLLRTNEITECNYDLDKIRVVRDMSEWRWLVQSISFEENIVFVDKFDLTDFKESIPFIEGSRNYFVLCAHRRLPECDWCTESYLEIQHDGHLYKLMPQEF